MNALTTIQTRKATRWTLTEALLAAGILAFFAAAVAVPSFASTAKRLQTGMEDIEASVKMQAATFLLVQKLGQMQ